MTIALSLVIAFLAGMLVILQTASNARLKDAFGEALPAIVISSLSGIVLLLGVMAVTRTPFPPLVRATSAPWTAWLGGLLGAAYAVAVVLLARKLGAATLTALVVSGQLICSVALDHFGLLGFDHHVASLGRLVGAGLMLTGLFLIWKF